MIVSANGYSIQDTKMYTERIRMMDENEQKQEDNKFQCRMAEPYLSLVKEAERRTGFNDKKLLEFMIDNGGLDNPLQGDSEAAKLIRLYTLKINVESRHLEEEIIHASDIAKDGVRKELSDKEFRIETLNSRISNYEAELSNSKKVQEENDKLLTAKEKLELENIKLSEQIKNLNDQVQGLQSKVCQSLDVANLNAEIEKLKRIIAEKDTKICSIESYHNGFEEGLEKTAAMNSVSTTEENKEGK